MIYDEVVKVPWIVHWRGVVRPGVIETPVSLVDLTPTVIDLVDSRDPIATEGRSLAASILDGTEPEPRPIVVERRLFEVAAHRGPAPAVCADLVAAPQDEDAAVVDQEGGHDFADGHGFGSGKAPRSIAFRARRWRG